MMMASKSDYRYIWFWKTKLPDRVGSRCRVLSWGRLNSVLVEFQDGFKVVTSRNALRKAVKTVEKNR